MPGQNSARMLTRSSPTTFISGDCCVASQSATVSAISSGHYYSGEPSTSLLSMLFVVIVVVVVSRVGVQRCCCFCAGQSKHRKNKRRATQTTGVAAAATTTATAANIDRRMHGQSSGVRAGAADGKRIVSFLLSTRAKITEKKKTFLQGSQQLATKPRGVPLHTAAVLITSWFQKLQKKTRRRPSDNRATEWRIGLSSLPPLKTRKCYIQKRCGTQVPPPSRLRFPPAARWHG